MPPKKLSGAQYRKQKVQLQSRLKQEASLMEKYLKQNNTNRALGNIGCPSAEEIEEQSVNDGSSITKELADLPDKEWECEESDEESSSFPGGVKERDDKEKSGLHEKERNNRKESALHDDRNSSEKNCTPQINTSDPALLPAILNSADTDHKILNGPGKFEDMMFPVNEKK